MVVALELKDVGYYLEDACLLDKISLRLLPGHLLQLVGANGSGKTTLLKILAGLLTTDVGEVKWCAEDRVHSDPSLYFAYLGHQNGLKVDLSVIENFNLSMSLLLPLPKIKNLQVRLKTYLSHFDLSEYKDRQVKYLSFGQKRKVALSRLFMLQRSVWLLDEPFVGLDDDSIVYIKDKMKEHCLSGGSIIMTGHRGDSIGNDIPTKILQL